MHIDEANGRARLGSCLPRHLPFAGSRALHLDTGPVLAKSVVQVL